jgi:hypothetical protein
MVKRKDNGDGGQDGRYSYPLVKWREKTKRQAEAQVLLPLAFSLAGMALLSR